MATNPLDAFSPKKMDSTIYRYMDFTKFVSMLENRGLWFSRANKLGDPFEGSMSLANLKLRPQLYGNDIPLDKLKEMEKIRKKMVKWALVNCWHMNEGESMAMWKIYGKSNEAIAIQSRCGLLQECLQDDKDINIGEVQYIDRHSDDPANFISERFLQYPFMYKDRVFEYENELRAIKLDLTELPRDDQGINLTKSEPPNSGMMVTIDLRKLLQGVTISPVSEPWFYDLVKNLLEKYELDQEILGWSSFKRKPVF